MVGVPSAMAGSPAAAVQAFEYHHGDVLGTALDLSIVAATNCKAVVATIVSASPIPGAARQAAIAELTGG